MFMPSGVIAAAQKGEQSYEMTAGQNTIINGFDRVVNAIGSIDPDVFLWDQYKFDRLMTVNTNQMFLQLGNGAPNNNLAFREIEISGTFGQGVDTLTLQRTDAVYTTPANSEWEWTIVNRSFVTGNTYQVIFRR